MTRLQRLQLAQSEKRAAMGVLLDAETPDQDAIGAMSLELRSMESTVQAAILAGEDVPIETRQDSGEKNEVDTLRGRIRFGEYIQAAMSQRAVGGVEREYNAAMHIPENRFPMDLLSGLETRAAIDGDAGSNQGTWLDRLFEGTAAERIGITMVSVAAGIASYPVMTSTASAAMRARAQAADSGVFTATVTEMKPKRGVVEGIYSIEDDARLPGLGEAIMRDLRGALVEGIDRKIFKGDSGASGTDADITGLQTAGITEVTLTQAAKIKGDETLKVFVGLVDGKHATGMGDVRIVASVGANTLWYGTIHNSAVDNQTVAQFLMASGVTWSTRGGIETATSNGDFGAYIGLARGIDGSARAAVWNAGELIRDPYSGAKKGEVSLTLNYLWDFAVPRTSNFRRLKFVS